MAQTRGPAGPMLIAIAFFAGLALGWRTARKRGGDLFDRMQYAAVYALIFGVVATVALVIVGNLTAGS